MDGLGEVADKGPLYIYVYQRNGLGGGGEFPLKFPLKWKNPKFK